MTKKEGGSTMYRNRHERRGELRQFIRELKEVEREQGKAKPLELPAWLRKLWPAKKRPASIAAWLRPRKWAPRKLTFAKRYEIMEGLL